MEFYVRLGERLRALRIRAGLSQAALGARLGRSPSAIDRYEMGQRRVALADLIRLAKILGVSPEAFLEGGATGRDRGPRKAPASSLADRLGGEHLRLLRAEHATLLRALDRRLLYPAPGGRPGRLGEASRAYGRRPARRAAGASAAAKYAATLPEGRLRIWAQRAGWRGPADAGVLRRYAELVLRAFVRHAGRDRR